MWKLFELLKGAPGRWLTKSLNYSSDISVALNLESKNLINFISRRKREKKLSHLYRVNSHDRNEFLFIRKTSKSFSG